MPLLPSSLPRARRPSWPLRLGAIVVAVAILWSLAWIATAHYTRVTFDKWIVTEADAGRTWTCPGERIDGFPVAMKLTCDRPTFRGEVAGHTAVGTMEALKAGMELDQPGALVVTLRGPLNLRAEDDAFEMELSWADVGLVVPGVLGAPAGGSLAATRLAVSLSSRTQGDLNLRAAQVTADVSPAGGASGDKSFSLAAKGVSFPTLDAMSGLDAPADVTAEGVLVDATLLTEPTVRRLEAWRMAGGILRLAALSFAKGSFSGAAQGTLALDGEHRPAGRLDTALKGFGPIAQRFGIPVAGVQLGGLLTSLLAGGKAVTTDKDSVQVPLILADGRLLVGPFATAVRFAPLY